MNRISIARLTRASLAAAALALAAGHAAAVPDWHDSYTVAAAFEENFPESDSRGDARIADLADLEDNRMSVTLFLIGALPDEDAPIQLAGFDPLETP